MKLISLNIWGGQAYAPLMDFLKTHAANTDIFCFQEVLRSRAHTLLAQGAHANILSELTDLLTDFNVIFAPEQERFDLEQMVNFDIEMGQATFVRKSHQIDSEGSVFVYRNRNEGTNIQTLPSNFLYIRLVLAGKKVTVANIHGVALPGDKLDNPDRLAQSQKIVDFFSSEKNAKIICGDFNLMPETQSIKMIENAGMIDLIKTWHIPETRSKLTSYYGKPGYQKFADFIFVSKEVEVKKFEVPSVEVSDHLPMILEFL